MMISMIIWRLLIMKTSMTVCLTEKMREKQVKIFFIIFVSFEWSFEVYKIHVVFMVKIKCFAKFKLLLIHIKPTFN